VGKHPTTRITDYLLSAVRACSNSGIENVPSVCATETTQEGAPSAALGSQIRPDDVVVVVSDRNFSSPHYLGVN
jgi:hypothetical protein